MSENPTISRRAALASIPMLAAVGVPAVAAAHTVGADPIFGAIEEHAAAMRAQSANARRVAELERSMPDRTWTWTTAVQAPPDGCPDLPEHIAAQLDTGATFARRNDAFVALMTTAPTSLAGIAALLDYLGSEEFPDEPAADADTVLLSSIASADPRCAAAVAAFPAHLAGAIRALTV